jgi:hypothetical protein
MTRVCQFVSGPGEIGAGASEMRTMVLTRAVPATQRVLDRPACSGLGGPAIGGGHSKVNPNSLHGFLLRPKLVPCGPHARRVLVADQLWDRARKIAADPYAQRGRARGAE